MSENKNSLNNMGESNFESPVYKVKKIPIGDIVAQRANPNSMSVRSFEALMISIYNDGFTMPVIISTNSEYDESTKGQPRPDLVDHVDDGKNQVANAEAGIQVGDDEVAKFFPYRLVDGSHRSQVIRLGRYYFNNGHDNSSQWAKGEDIPEDPGKDMLSYLAWRENFTVPCTLLEVDPMKAMSATVLHNPIYSEQEVYVIRDVD